MRLLPAPTCPVCQHSGPIAYTHCPDPLGAQLGADDLWRFRQCTHCTSLWLDPRPSNDDIPSLYPTSYYTHSPKIPTPLVSPTDLPARIAWSAKLALVEKHFGYANLSTRAP